MTVNFLSLVTTPLQLLCDETKLATGTAFFYRGQDKIFLITNWHNITGRHPETNRCIGKNKGIPNKFRITLHEKPIHDALQNQNGANERKLNYKNYEYSLFNEGESVWHTFRQDEKIVDVVAIPINLPEDVIYGCINDYPFTKFITPHVSDDVFIIGYPWGLTGGTEVFPIWKRGTIASEPDANYGGMSRMLIDSYTATGMSGSPVIGKRDGFHHPDGNILDPTTKTMRLDTVMGQVENFFGVYSGRLESKLDPNDIDEFKETNPKEVTSLGIVWKASLIDEMINVVIDYEPLQPINSENAAYSNI